MEAKQRQIKDKFNTTFMQTGLKRRDGTEKMSLNQVTETQI